MRPLSSLLLLAACAPQPTPDATVGHPTTADSPWAVELGARVEVACAAISDDSGAYSANIPRLGGAVRFDAAGATALSRNGTIRLRLGQFGRSGDERALEAVAPQLGEGVPGLVGPDGALSRRLTYAHDGVTEWFVGAPEGLEHGWTLDERPEGGGGLRFGIDTDAVLLDVSVDVATWLDDAGSEWRYADPAAFDSTGEPLDIWFSAEGDHLVVNVDDAGATYPIEIDPVLTTADATLTGSAASGRFGESVSTAGDVNNDGYDDVIVGASRVSSNTGRAYVYHGSATGLSTTASTTLSGGNSSGSTPYYYCGGRVAGGGDVNNDGYDDVLMACIYTTGSVQVFHGSASGVSSTVTSTLTGTKGTNFGYGLALVPSVDGDGYDDVVVGAPAQSAYRGAVTVYAGSASGVSSTASVSLTGVLASYYGLTIRSAGDVDNDGYNDIVVGAPVYLVGYGRASVYYGSSSGITSTSVDHLYGSGVEGLGTSLAGGGDLNGDGYDDIVVGTFETSTGHAYVYEGSSSGISSTAATTLTGGAYFGSSMAMLADMDADGYADVAVGAPGTEVSVFRGSASGLGTSSVADVSESGTYYGYSLDGADVDGDGYTDLVVGDYSDSTLYGKAYVYLGYADDDGDGYGGGGADATDCDDADATVNPDASEVTGDGVDQNCDGEELCLSDNDDDGYLDGSGATVTSSDSDCDDANEGTTADPTTDCDDSDATVNPAATEGIGDEVDQDCDAAELCFDDDDEDETLDTSGDSVASADLDCDDLGEGTTGTPTTDCDDSDASINTSATEIAGDEVDQNCDGEELCLSDSDDDGYLGGSGATVASSDADCDDADEGTTTDPTTDCDDADAAINPAATEGIGDEVDQDCDGAELCFDDDDGDETLDTSGDSVASADLDCDDPGEGTTSTPTTDCDDTDAAINTSATEIAGDEVDQDCDGGELCYADADGDGYRDSTTIVSADELCSGSGEATATEPDDDCDEGDPGVNPGADEVCDAALVDENCDGLTNDPTSVDASIWYTDADGDGYGDGSLTEVACDAPAGTSANDDDCDDTDADVSPAGTEVCGGADEDCDGLTDDADPDVVGTVTLYTDADGDGYGDPSAPVSGCSPAGSVVENADDCDDADALVNPSVSETLADGIDQDCDDGDLCYADADSDGYRGTGSIASADLDCTDAGEAGAAAPSDCDDDDASVNPSATESAGDGVDQDCDLMEACYGDADADGYRDSLTYASANLACDGAGEADAATPDGDCDDTDANSYPGATEVVADEIDQDCDGSEDCYVDGDEDGYLGGATIAASADTDCSDAGEGSVTSATGDCNDADDAYHPGAAETDCADPNDYNCDGATGYDDIDGDGWAACEECDDTSTAVNPDATEKTGDGIDQDCDGVETCFVDADGDGHRPDATSTVASTDTDCRDGGEATDEAATDDCNDADATIVPGATELPGDGVDQDCDGMELCYVDGDADAYRADDTTTASADGDCDDAGEGDATTTTGDCDDGDAAYHPGATEDDCGDPNDYNCDGSTGLDDLDGDGFGACEECNDALATVNPDAIEICNGLDDDCSGAVDDHAIDAATLHADNDGDGYGNPTVAGTSCSDNPGYVEDGTDCDDGRSDVYPGAEDPPGDGIDQNCDGSDGITEDTGEPDSGDAGDSGDLAEARVGGLFGGCDSSGGAGLALGGVLLAAAAGMRRRT